MIKPVRCVLIEIEPRKVVIKRMIGRVALWFFAVLYIMGLHIVLVSHVAWVIEDGRERAERDKLIKQGAYVVEGSYKGVGYRRGR